MPCNAPLATVSHSSAEVHARGTPFRAQFRARRGNQAQAPFFRQRLWCAVSTTRPTTSAHGCTSASLRTSMPYASSLGGGIPVEQVASAAGAYLRLHVRRSPVAKGSR